MAGKPQFGSALGSRMPHRLLQLMPEVWRRGYLLRQSGGDDKSKVFNLAKHLKKHKNVALIWPHTAAGVLTAYPAIRNLREAESPDISWTHFVEAATSELIAGLFPGTSQITWSQGDSAWHDPPLQAAVAALRACAPDTVLNLMRPCPPVLRAVMNSSGAALRICVDEECPWPYANVRLQTAPAQFFAGRFFQVLDPWRYSGFPLQERWERIQPGAGQTASAREQWLAANAAPEATWLYLHDLAAPGRILDDALHALLLPRLRAQDRGEFALGLAAWNPSGLPLEKTGAWSGVPFFNITDLAGLLGLLDSARGVAAFPGFGLQFASLTEARVAAFLRKDEAEFDLSRWNPLFRVEWV